MTGTGDKQSVKEQRRSEEQMKGIEERESHRSIVEEKLFYYTPTGSDTSTERLPDEEYINGILHGGSPSPSPVPTLTAPNTPPADHPDNHRTGPLPPVDR